MSCPSSFKSFEVSELPSSMYNFSYYSLFPAPTCPKCGFGVSNTGQCASYENQAPVLNKAALYTSGNCPYGHIQLPGTTGCTSLLTGAFRAPTGYTTVNGQLVQTSLPRKTNSCCCE